MAGVYRPRHPERTVLYRVLFHHFDGFLAAYEELFGRVLPAGRQGGGRPLSRLRQPPLGFCPPSVSALPGGAAGHVLLPHPGLLRPAFSIR